HDLDYVATLREASTLASNTSSPAAGGSFGVATGTFPIAEAAGKKVTYSGYIKTEGVTRGSAGLWWRVDGASGVLAFDNMQSRGATGTSDWKRYVIELPVDASVKNINFGMLMPGDGAAWFDALTIELDGQPYTDQSVFDLDFESTSPRGFYTGGNGYRVELDAEVAQSGKQSLRMRRVAPTPDEPTRPEPKIAAAQWKGVVAHLEARRAAYRATGAADHEIDWAIQNARVVLQGMQMRGNEVTRDHSMADNVKWILDHNPNAKIVLWAHNGHVAAGGFPNETMGAVLRRMMSKEMVVFGFAFNQGSFQAIPQGGGALKNFTVPPAPAGSLDATLAASQIPLFALDLRQAPEWFKEP
ncbi:MAG: erythromycin esterase family protein, partial [Vicinamibacterales bacterium]